MLSMGKSTISMAIFNSYVSLPKVLDVLEPPRSTKHPKTSWAQWHSSRPSWDGKGQHFNVSPVISLKYLKASAMGLEYRYPLVN